MVSINNILIEKLAMDLGFDLVGFAPAENLERETTRLTEWLEAGYNSGMSYMERNIEKRKDLRLIFPEAKSVISLAKNYYVDEPFSDNKNIGKVSRYAWGKDYHYILWDKLDKLINEVQNLNPEFNAKYYVDTGPVMDKVWAIKSGLGWMGKNTNVINKEIGSWIFLCTVITNWEFNYKETAVDMCGSCTRCIDACPTNALIDEYVLDANKCISYLTIENKKEIPDEFIGKMNEWIFGCDICQDVCPWNIKFSKETNEPGFFPVEGIKELSLNEISQYNNDQFKQRFKNSPLMRTRLKGLKRNAEFLMKTKAFPTNDINKSND